LQNANDHPGKLERIFPSINLRVSFLRIPRKETQKSFDPTKARCCKLVQQGWKNSIVNLSSFEFPADFGTKETYEKRCISKLSAAI
jgi:hypothetical protein